MNRSAAVAVVATLVVASAVPSAQAARGSDEPGCGQGVAVVVDANELGGGASTTCVDREGAAVELFAAAGVDLEFASNLQDFVCRVGGRPTDRPCTDGDSYWSLWWAESGGEWIYSALGVRSLEIAAGGSLAFAWHQGDGEASPPDVEVGGTGSDEASADPVAGPEKAESGSASRWWPVGGLVVLVLGAALVVAMLRRRSG